MSSYNYAEIHREFNKNNRFWLAHREQEIGALMRTSIFCVDKICFPKPIVHAILTNSLITNITAQCSRQ